MRGMDCPQKPGSKCAICPIIPNGQKIVWHSCTLSTAEAEQGLRAAIAAWNNSGAAIYFDIKDPDYSGTAITFDYERNPCGGAAACAGEGSDIVQIDTTPTDTYGPWALTEDDCINNKDKINANNFQGTMTHELGHILDFSLYLGDPGFYPGGDRPIDCGPGRCWHITSANGGDLNSIMSASGFCGGLGNNSLSSQDIMPIIRNWGKI